LAVPSSWPVTETCIVVRALLFPHPVSVHRGLELLDEDATYVPDVPEKVPVDIAAAPYWMMGGNVGNGGKM
jgi:hypothetical protein